MKSSKINKEVYHNDSNIYNEETMASLSLLDNKSATEKLSDKREKERLLGGLCVDSSSEEEEESECENKDLKQNGWKNEKNLLQKERNLQEGGSEIKSTGFLDYYSMLESKAKEKSQSVSSDLDLELEWSGITSPVNQNKVKSVSAKSKADISLWSIKFPYVASGERIFFSEMELRDMIFFCSQVLNVFVFLQVWH